MDELGDEPENAKTEPIRDEAGGGSHGNVRDYLRALAGATQRMPTQYRAVQSSPRWRLLPADAGCNLDLSHRKQEPEINLRDHRQGTRRQIRSVAQRYGTGGRGVLQPRTRRLTPDRICDQGWLSLAAFGPRNRQGRYSDAGLGPFRRG